MNTETEPQSLACVSNSQEHRNSSDQTHFREMFTPTSQRSDLSPEFALLSMLYALPAKFRAAIQGRRQFKLPRPHLRHSGDRQ